MRSSMPRSGAEVAGVELIDGMDLGKGRGRWMEHDRDGRCESARGHAVRAGLWNLHVFLGAMWN